MPSLIPAARRFYLRTFGCQMNRHDSERIAGMLEARGWRRSRNAEKADLILLNTCSVRDHAEARVLGRLEAYRREKKKRPQVAIGVLGCMAQVRGELLRDRFPELDLILGPGCFGRLPAEAAAALSGSGPRVADSFDPDGNFFRGPCLRENSLCAWVTVMRGCDNFCSYCVVPFARGREISRSPDEIVEEVRSLGEGGYREITLLGQNVNSYRGMSLSGSGVDFPGLLRRVNAVSGIDRIRFITSHPKDISPDLIRAIGELEKVCESLHFPAQSGSDAVLEKMRRGYTRDEYLAKARSLREAVPDISLASDFIVGFPGETDADFTRTLDLVREVRFERIFAFAYSPRPKTAAAAFPDDVPPEVKAARLQELLALQKTISGGKNRELIGKTVEVLVEGRNRKYGDRAEGRTRGGQMVFFPWEEGIKGEIVPVRVERATEASLFGNRVDGN